MIGMWRVIRSSVAGKGGGRTLPDVTPDDLSRFFVGMGPRVAGEVQDMGEAPRLPCTVPRVGACALILSPLTLSELRATVFSMSGSGASWDDHGPDHDLGILAHVWLYGYRSMGENDGMCFQSIATPVSSNTHPFMPDRMNTREAIPYVMLNHSQGPFCPG